MSSVVTDIAVRGRTSPETFETPVEGVWSAVRTRFADYAELTKPRIAVMVLLTVTVGYALGCRGEWRTAALVHALIGIGLAAAASSAFNQWLERATDARMRRTANRPLPAGRLLTGEVLWFATIMGLAAIAYLLAFTNVATAGLTLLTLALYGLAYTPLKRHTSLCTAIGAVPGALPRVLGWTAAGGALGIVAGALFGILFLWQFPHFLAIAWKYREEYERAGLRMLPAVRVERVVGCLAAGYALALIPVSLLPRQLGLGGDLYLATALVLGVGYAGTSLRFAFRETNQTARRLILVSLVYLPILLAVLTFDHWRLLQ
jgi:protoheme IX farnesyltransferase